MNQDFTNFYSTLKLDESENGKFQLLLASQLYGTNFSVFGQFQVTQIATKKGEPKKCTIDYIDLRLFNYKGTVNLGFSTLPKDKPILEIAGPKNNEYVRLNLTLRAIISKKAKYTAEVIKKDGLEISDKMGLLVERSLVPISGNIASNPIYKGIFDEEFYTRNGAIYTEKVIKRLNDPDIAKMTNIKIKKIDENLFEPTGPGVTCYNAHFQIAVS